MLDIWSIASNGDKNEVKIRIWTQLDNQTCWNCL